jgi:hypothetical protein
MRFRRLIAVVTTFAVLMNISGVAMAGMFKSSPNAPAPHCAGMADMGVDSDDAPRLPAVPDCCADGACACVAPAVPGFSFAVVRLTAAHVPPRSVTADFGALAPPDESLRPPIRIIAE